MLAMKRDGPASLVNVGRYEAVAAAAMAVLIDESGRQRAASQIKGTRLIGIALTGRDDNAIFNS
ncbi:MAG: hypothetical protein JHC46_07055 [Solirubrobacteraceae bacterium]|nr:hypothetical protein [Solirubrobacteraceae bacterium]